MKDLLVNLFSIPVPDTTERRMVRYFVFQGESSEPAIGEIKVDFLTQTSVRINAVEIRHQYHSKLDNWINGRASSPLYIARGGQFADECRFDNAVNLPEQVVFWDERLQINDRPGPGLKDMQPLHQRLHDRKQGD
jgi:hypothetical protein|tara:strand:- start:1944 stop:2348 length:405 start_codon:yes stop_codon:yes gene_type:complete